MLHELSEHRLIRNNLHCKNIILHFCKSYSDLNVQLCFIKFTIRYDVIIIMKYEIQIKTVSISTAK